VVGFWLVGLRLALPLGVLLGILNMVPYLQLVGVPVALLLAVVRGIESTPDPTPTSILWSLGLVAFVFLIVQVIQDWVLTPRIMGQSTGLRPVILMVGLFVWGKLLGFLGVVLAIPLTCMGIAGYRKLVLGHRPKASGIAATPPKP
jgi:predicted PurR-regulated permease PerM